MTSKEIRQKYLEFFSSKGGSASGGKSRGHVIIPSASLIPENDSSTLFIGSGMQPLVPYLLGAKHPAGTRLVNSQKSFRAEDIEDVGDSRHHTVFEMLGNWSLGDYFKQEQLSWIFEFLTKEINIDPKRLYVTVFRGNDEIGIPRDAEAVEIWKKLFLSAGIEAKDVDNSWENGLDDGRIFYYGDKNWWSRSGAPAKMPVGEPGGPDSEMFYDLGADLKRHENSPWKDEPCHVNCDCGRFVEIGNNVFMEFIRTEKGFEKLPQKNVDFGGGLERLTMVAQGKDNSFETDMFEHILNKISMLSGGKVYKDNVRAFEVIADHLKAATFIVGDDKGILPSNVGAGYIVRRLLRRAIRYGRMLGITEYPWTKEIAKIVAHDYGDVFPELRKNIDFVIEEFKKEEEKFNKTIEKGLKEFEKFSSFYKDKDWKHLSDFSDVGKKLFDLFQTYGFPLEMSLEELSIKKIYIPIEKMYKEFEEEQKKHQEQSRTASAGTFKGGLADASRETTKLHTAAHLLLAALRKVLGDHVTQKGSNITAERLRFDFSHPEKMTDAQKIEVEKIVNEAIAKDLPVSCEELNLDEAKAKGAMGVFDSKYGEKVKVYKIGEGSDVISYEICGGPHVERTGELGHFKIQKEESSSSGVRRIKAILE
ncbi:MAG: alanine--tRNA ligase [Patescibacteria group bacterium]|nr:alanine--tRNA ligase [Patescibacteria group bacterium]MDD4610542.1 alanine--tRNA ligase [Patescibacteria group bacterium]